MGFSLFSVFGSYEEGSGAQSGEPQSNSIRTSSTWRIYASGVVRDDLAAPDKGVNVIIA